VCVWVSTVGYSPTSLRPELRQSVHLQLHVAQLPLYRSFSVASAAWPVSPPRSTGRCRRPTFHRLELHRDGGGRTLCEDHVPSEHAGPSHHYADCLSVACTDRPPNDDGGMTSTSTFVFTNRKTSSTVIQWPCTSWFLCYHCGPVIVCVQFKQFQDFRLRQVVNFVKYVVKCSYYKRETMKLVYMDCMRSISSVSVTHCVSNTASIFV